MNRAEKAELATARMEAPSALARRVPATRLGFLELTGPPPL
jgi:hypothetical protein